VGSGPSDQDELITAINITPLVDVMLVLLVIFMVTTELIHEMDKPMVLPIELPAAASSEEMLSKGLMSFIIDKKGVLYLNTQPVEASVISKTVAAIRAQKITPQALISADQGVAHGSVVELMDRLRILGVRQIAFNTKRQTIE
jgi:biopolymer transport protein TolR